MSYFVYVLESERKSARYIGYSEDLAARLKEHNCGRKVSTRCKGPWKIIYLETCPTLELAKKREKFFKTGQGRAVLSNLISSPSYIGA
jgi:putative endonuclease